MKRILFCFPILIAISFTSCSPGKMSVSSTLKENHDEYPVKGRNGVMINQRLSFGEFTTAKVKRSWTKGSSMQMGFMDVIWTSYEKKKQTFNFQLSDAAGNISDVYCITKLQSQDLNFGSNPNNLFNIMTDLLKMGGYKSDNTFGVEIYRGKDEKPWQMFIDNISTQADPNNYTGFLALSPSEYYSITPVTKMEVNGKSGNTLLGSIGFEFKDAKGNAVAAVSTLDNGMVFLGKTTTEERFLLANACAALLLQEVID